MFKVGDRVLRIMDNPFTGVITGLEPNEEFMIEWTPVSGDGRKLHVSFGAHQLILDKPKDPLPQHLFDFD